VSVPALIFIAVIVVQRLGELFLARHNTSRLLARGGREVGAEHYPLIVAVHVAWILALVVFGWKSALIWPWIGGYVVMQFLRLWILSSLGARWTTRIIVIDEPLVRRGPYRFVRHPNYLLVAAELIVAAMALDLPIVALVFTVLNSIVLTIRIRSENTAWQQA
jgi:methyltransferase